MTRESLHFFLTPMGMENEKGAEDGVGGGGGEDEGKDEARDDGGRHQPLGRPQFHVISALPKKSQGLQSSMLTLCFVLLW